MSDISVPLTSPAAVARSPVQAGAVAPGGRLGVGATVAWGTAGLVAIMIFWITGQLQEPVRWMRLDSYPVLVALSFGHVAAVGVVAAALWSRGLRFRDYLALPSLQRRDVGRGVAYGLLGYLVLVVAYQLIPLVQSAFGFGSDALSVTQLPIMNTSAWGLLTLWFGMVIAAPIAEEILFRGFLYRGLAESSLGAFGAIVLSSVAFGLLHFPGFGWPRVVGTACVGLLFGWLRWRTGNTGTGIVAHAVMNLVGAIMLTTIIFLA